MIPTMKLDHVFLAHLLIGYKSQLLQLVDTAGHGTGRLSTDKLIDFQLAIPSKDEQFAIVSCLSSLDDAIGSQNRIFNLLSTHKNGLMQQLFPSLEDDDS